MRYWLVLVMVVALSGCAGFGAVPSGTNGAGVVTATKAPSGVRHTHPEQSSFTKPAHVDGRTVTFTFQGGSCNPSDPDKNPGETRWIDVRETDTTVTLTANIVETARLCAGVGLDLPARVTLKKPLGNRTLVDGGCAPGSHDRLVGACGSTVHTGTCDGATYAVTMPVADNGAVTLHVELTSARPGSRWSFRWTQGSHDDRKVDASNVVTDAAGHASTERSMGNIADRAHLLRTVQLIPRGVAACKRVYGPPPVWYGS